MVTAQKKSALPEAPLAGALGQCMFGCGFWLSEFSCFQVLKNGEDAEGEGSSVWLADGGDLQNHGWWWCPLQSTGRGAAKAPKFLYSFTPCHLHEIKQCRNLKGLAHVYLYLVVFFQNLE